VTISTFDTDGRPFTLITHPEPDGRITLHIVVGSKKGTRNVVASMVHLSVTDSQALRSITQTPKEER
jgi:hypothetical protein